MARNKQINEYTNKRIYKLIAIGLLVYSIIGLLVVFPAKASAASCTPIYGGGPTCTDNSLTVRSKVLNPSTNKFVENLSTKDPRYTSGDRVTFQITVTNTGDKTIDTVLVKDAFPSLLTFVDGPGKFDKNKNTLTFSVNNLSTKHSQLFTVTAKVVGQNTFPQQCALNAISALPSSGSVAQDSSQLCFTKLTTSTLKTTPATGAESFALLALFPTAIVGFKIKKLKI